MFGNCTTAQLQAELKSLRQHRAKLIKQGTMTAQQLDGHLARIERELQKRSAR